MKPINLTEEDKVNLFQKMFEKFKKELDNYGFNTTDSTLSVKTGFCQEAKDKIHIMYTQEAYLRMQALVDFFNTEVAWYGLVDKIDDLTYRIYDIKVCKQYVDGAKVDTEDEDVLKFFSNLNDDEAEHMHFQAHSHVKMGTTASAVDMQNQQDVIKSMGKTGFYIFQIWNKNGDINTYLYDLDKNTFYDRKDVIIDIEDALGTLDDFLFSISELVEEKKKYPYQWNYQNNNYKKTEKEEKKTESKEHAYQEGYWDGMAYYERWDW